MNYCETKIFTEEKELIKATVFLTNRHFKLMLKKRKTIAIVFQQLF